LPKKTFEEVRASGSSLLVQVKGNQPSLKAALEALPEKAQAADTFMMKDKVEHGRQENRLIEVFMAGSALGLLEWESYATVAIRVTRVTHSKIAKTGLWDTSKEISWYITDLSGRTAAYYGNAIRSHWGVENPNHNVRDGAFQEDASRIRKNPTIMARLRSFGLNILRFNGVTNIAKTLYENSLDLDLVLAYAAM
jgi:predicted transposase YbfD/YdcC